MAGATERNDLLPLLVYRRITDARRNQLAQYLRSRT